MEWTYNDLYAFKNKVLNYKEDYMGERMGDYVFGGAGNKCIKLNASVPEDSIFVSYEDVLSEKSRTAKAVFDYFFNEKGDDKMKIEYGKYESNEFDSQYMMKFNIVFNGEKIIFDDGVWFEDPFTEEEKQFKDILYDNGYVLEVPKDYFDDADKSIIDEYYGAFKEAFAKTLVKELGVYGKARKYFNDNQASIIEQDYEERDINELAVLTDEAVENELKEML